jgi:hypothetical protein
MRVGGAAFGARAGGAAVLGALRKLQTGPAGSSSHDIRVTGAEQPDLARREAGPARPSGAVTVPWLLAVRLSGILGKAGVLSRACPGRAGPESCPPSPKHCKQY